MFSLFILSLLGTRIGLNAGAQYDTSAVAKVAASGASVVRLNFIVTSSQSSTSDPLFSTGREVRLRPKQPCKFRRPFKTACADIITRWQDRIHVFELFNEPNDWAGGTSSQVTPYWFAKFLQTIYEQKYYNHWPALLVSGPLFSFDGTDASDYLYATYVAGMTQLAWDWFHQNAGTYPLDGIGYHIYTTQGSTDPATVSAGVTKNLAGFWKNGVVAGESYRSPNPYPKKQLWISEYGWGSKNVGEAGQAADLNTALGVLTQNPNVAMTMWFTLQDWGDQGWGLLRADGTQKAAWSTFVSWARR